jgi:hypothetical protein
LEVVAGDSDGVRAKVLVVRALRKEKGREKERKTKIPLKKRAETCGS